MAVSLLDLSTELLLCIFSYLPNSADKNSLIRTSRHLHAILIQELYVHAVSLLDVWQLFPAAGAGKSGTLRRFIEAIDRGIVQASKRFDIQWHPRDSGKRTLTEASDDSDAPEMIPYIPSGDLRFRGFPSHVPIEVFYREAMSFAIHFGHIEALKVLMKASNNGIDSVRAVCTVIASVAYGPHQIAARGNQPEMIKFLYFEIGIDVPVHTRFIQRRKHPAPVEVAAECGSAEALQELFRLGHDDIDYDDMETLNSALVSAIENDQDETTWDLLHYGVYPFSCPGFEVPSLHLATIKNSPYAMESLLSWKLNPNGLDDEGNGYVVKISELRSLTRRERVWGRGDILIKCLPHDGFSTPLCIAVFMGFEELVSLLLDFGADPNLLDSSGYSPLGVALSHRHPDLVCLLINSGAKVDVADSWGRPALHYAMSHVSETNKFVDIILDAGPLEDEKDWLFRILEYAHSVLGVSLPPNIISHRELVEGPTKRTPLLSSTRDDRYLLDVEYQQNYEFGTSFCKCYLSVELFLNKGYDLNSQDRLGRTLFHQAAYWLCVRMTKFLLDKGADATIKDAFGQTPLHLTMLHLPRKASLCQLQILNLVHLGCVDVNARDMNGDTALHLAARNNNFRAAKILYLGANPQEHPTYALIPDKEPWNVDFSAKDANGHTPFHVAAITHPETCNNVLYWLQKAGGSCDCVTPKGVSYCELWRQQGVKELRYGDVFYEEEWRDDDYYDDDFWQYRNHDRYESGCVDIYDSDDKESEGEEEYEEEYDYEDEDEDEDDDIDVDVDLWSTLLV
ncbi:hypothetical protein N7456_008417 [Penicillium angulare]|uniref:F-box domain-containing protein n=1 Tax=Penicillium angulare TaxID=116970 RepID=A0A9W9K9M7_9EURO|nr:hypothetical protein N7456_008417 [Penicillium angulare]